MQGSICRKNFNLQSGSIFFAASRTGSAGARADRVKGRKAGGFANVGSGRWPRRGHDGGQVMTLVRLVGAEPGIFVSND